MIGAADGVVADAKDAGHYCCRQRKETVSEWRPCTDGGDGP